MATRYIEFTAAMDIAQFKWRHVYLEIDDLLKVQYREKSHIFWQWLTSKRKNTFRCNLCKTPFLGHVKNIIEHIRSRRHFTAAQSLGEIYHPKFCPETINPFVGKPNPAIEKSKQANGKGSSVPNPMAVVNPAAPNSTPNKESKIQDKAPMQIQSKDATVATNIQNKPLSNSPKPESDADVEGLIGVEYVLKILRNAADQSPRFECCLCELETDGPGLQGHLKSPIHRMKYLDRHFPTCMRPFQTVRNVPSARTMVVEILESISVAIEKHYGRGVSFECLHDDLLMNRHAITSKVFSFQHVSEYSGPSFVNVVEKYILQEMVKNKETCGKLELEPKRKPPLDAGDQVSVKCSREEDQLVNTSSLVVEDDKKLDQFVSSTKRDCTRRRSRRSQRSLDHSSDASSQSGSRHECLSYRRMLDHFFCDLDIDFKRFECDPQYQQEWITFWKKRSEQLENEKRKYSSVVGENKRELKGHTVAVLENSGFSNNNEKTSTQLFCDMLAMDMRKLNDSSQRQLRIRILMLLDNHITAANM